MTAREKEITVAEGQKTAKNFLKSCEKPYYILTFE
jgi:hypothetical protein